MNKELETIIIGLGATGSAALYQLAKRGNKVLGIDQFSPPHNLGSSHGESRITRQAVGEGEAYVPLVLRSNEIWQEVGKETNTKIFYPTGGLILESQNSQIAAHGRFNFLDETIAIAKKYNIKHDILDTAQIKSKFPQFKVTNEKGYFEYDSGFLNPETCIQTQLALAQKYGASINQNEQVLNINPSNSNDKVTVITDKAQYESEKVIIAVGPWINQFINPEHADLFKVYRQVMFWFNVDTNSRHLYSPTNCPVYIWIFETGGEFGFYGFPSVDGQTIKMATEQFTSSTTPASVDRNVKVEEIQKIYKDFIENRLQGINQTCAHAESCLYTATPDSNFIIDFDPQHPQILIASPCSGHGFKHSAAVGEVLADLTISGKSHINIDKFKFARFGR